MSIVDEKKKEAPQDSAFHTHEPGSNMFEGKVVSVTGDQLLTTCKEGKEHAHTLSEDASFTCDGAICKVENLKPGSNIRGTTYEKDHNLALGIEILD